MKRLLLIFLTILSVQTMAEWVEYDSDVNNNKYFYEAAKIHRQVDLVFVWHRTRYSIATEYGDYSSAAYYKINCLENTIQFLSITFYSDENWLDKNWAGKQGQINFIRPNSQEKKLQNIVCMN